MTRANQTLIAIRLDPELLAAVDHKRAMKRQSRSELVREAIYELVKDLGTVPKDIIYPQDRVGQSKGGRPRKVVALEVVPGVAGGKTKKQAG